MTIDFFPKTKVTGAAFCNRTAERAKLSRYIGIGRHCWIQEYRRHGKTSLVEQTISDILEEEKLKLAYARVHLRFTSDVDNVAKKIISAVDSLTYTILTSKLGNRDLSNLLTRGSEILSNTFQKLTPSLRIENSKVKVSTTGAYDLDTLEASLKGLDKLAKKLDFRAVLFIDEFQEIGKLKNYMQVESSIRECLEDAEATTFILAGSERALMSQALTDQKRPLFNHTQVFELSRIEAGHYKRHLNKLAVERWGKEMPNKSFEKIMFLTQRHPYYVNSLCDELWFLEVLPSPEDVESAWQYVVQIASRENAHEITSLTPNERKVIMSIAKGINTKMTSAEVASKLNLATSSIESAIKQLVKNDTIGYELKSKSYYVVDPALATIAIMES